jgi:hypothetical protein
LVNNKAERERERERERAKSTRMQIWKTWIIGGSVIGGALIIGIIIIVKIIYYGPLSKKRKSKN